MKFRKKPIVIEAEQWDGSAVEAVRLGLESLPVYDRAVWVIHTLEGPLTATPGDYIIVGVRGERYPCKPDIFAATYEPA
jgi:hypothetical protein